MTQTQPRPKAKRAEPNPSRFTMTDFRKVATSGEVHSFSALARNFGIDKATAERTCKLHGIKPSFLAIQ
jgi:hypothetical protein